jgi:hypothetical protein
LPVSKKCDDVPALHGHSPFRECRLSQAAGAGVVAGNPNGDLVGGCWHRLVRAEPSRIQPLHEPYSPRVAEAIATHVHGWCGAPLGLPRAHTRVVGTVGGRVVVHEDARLAHVRAAPHEDGLGGHRGGGEPIEALQQVRVKEFRVDLR